MAAEAFFTTTPAGNLVDAAVHKMLRPQRLSQVRSCGPCVPAEGRFGSATGVQVRHLQGVRISASTVRDQKVGGSDPLAPTALRVPVVETVHWKKLWQGFSKNPDFAAKADVVDRFLLSEINNLRVFNGGKSIRLTGSLVWRKRRQMAASDCLEKQRLAMN